MSVDPIVTSFITAINKAYDEAEAYVCTSKKDWNNISYKLLNEHAMSGMKTRIFYNCLLANSKANKYLEIGTWKGITFCCTMMGNKHTESYVVDNWSQFNATKRAFEDNCKKWLTQGEKVKLIDGDCYAASTIEQIPDEIDVLLYDGDHSYDAHARVLSHYITKCSPIFVFIVDDWNWEDVRRGTAQTLKESGVSVVYEKAIRLTQDNSHTPDKQAKEGWWNGIYIAVCVRP